MLSLLQLQKLTKRQENCLHSSICGKTWSKDYQYCKIKLSSQCSMRDIPLPRFIVEIAERFADSPNAFVLSGDKNKYVEPRTMQNHFKAYIKESRIEDANYHALRHTFATRCIEVGFDIKTLSTFLSLILFFGCNEGTAEMLDSIGVLTPELNDLLSTNNRKEK